MPFGLPDEPTDSGWARLLSIGIPVLAGVAAAATPATARGVGALGNFMSLGQQMSEVERKNRAQRQLGTRLTDILGQQAEPAVPGVEIPGEPVPGAGLVSEGRPARRYSD